MLKSNEYFSTSKALVLHLKAMASSSFRLFRLSHPYFNGCITFQAALAVGGYAHKANVTDDIYLTLLLNVTWRNTIVRITFVLKFH